MMHRCWYEGQIVKARPHEGDWLILSGYRDRRIVTEMEFRAKAIRIKE